MKKHLSLILTFVLGLTMCFSVASFGNEIESEQENTDTIAVETQESAEFVEPEATTESSENLTAAMVDDDIILKVYEDSTLKKSFTLGEIEQLMLSEGSKKYNYSAYNTWPTYKPVIDAEGPTVKGLIEAAGINFDSIEADQKIKFYGSDGVGFPFTKERLFRDRYYYPNARHDSYQVGGEVVPETENGKVLVEPILNMNDDGRLCYGQITPNDQNYSRFCQYTAHRDVIPGGGPEKVGKIYVLSEKAEKGLPITCEKYKDGASIPVGTKVTFESPYMDSERYWMYYTTDGSDPKVGSKLYNSSIYNGYINPPVIQRGKNTIKYYGYGYDMLDSDIVEFTFYGVTPAPSGVYATNSGLNSVRVGWNAVSGATKYSVYRNNVKIAEVAGTSYNNGGLALGQYYSYKVAAWVDGEEGQFSNTVSAMPAVNTPVITKLSPGKKKIKVKWSKSTNSNGYKVYRATSPNGKYKCVKTIKEAKTTSFTCKKLKKKTTYYFKVIAYKKIGKKYYYGYYSAVKGARTK